MPLSLQNFDPVGAPKDIIQIRKYFSLFFSYQGDKFWELLHFDLKKLYFSQHPSDYSHAESSINISIWRFVYLSGFTWPVKIVSTIYEMYQVLGACLRESSVKAK